MEYADQGTHNTIGNIENPHNTIEGIVKTGGEPPRILIYGPQKVGKSSFAAAADRPIFVQAENGLTGLNVDAFPLARNFGDISKALETLATKDHGYKTLCVDSVDWLEPLVWGETIRRMPYTEKGKKVDSIEDYGYGKGYVHTMAIWREYIDMINYLRDVKRMAIIQIAHAQIRKFENPETDSYDRYEIKLQKSASALLMEHSDIILFANYYVGVKKEDKAMLKDGRTRAVGSGERILYTEERPAFVAGNRYSLPPEIPFKRGGDYWNVIANHVPFYQQAN